MSADSDTRLYYAGGRGGHSGPDRTLHPDPDCRHLAQANSIRDCAASHAPPGRRCAVCGDGGAVQ